jgi:chemotaxis-related protein WspD
MRQKLEFFSNEPSGSGTGFNCCQAVGSPTHNQNAVIKAENNLAVRSTIGPSKADIVDCWNQTGVNGDATCPELPKFVHCRNCPVYSATGVQLLDRELPQEYRRQWTDHYSRPRKNGAAGRTSCVVFRIGIEWLALPTSVFREIAEKRSIHSLPHQKKGIILGVANVRGELLICVSLGRFLGLEHGKLVERTGNDYDRLVVTEWNAKLLAFPVNEVAGIHAHQPEELKQPPATLRKSASSYTRGIIDWMNQPVACLDEELLFSTLNRSLT